MKVDEYATDEIEDIDEAEMMKQLDEELEKAIRGDDCENTESKVTQIDHSCYSFDGLKKLVKEKLDNGLFLVWYGLNDARDGYNVMFSDSIGPGPCFGFTLTLDGFKTNRTFVQFEAFLDGVMARRA
jgi:hypothetical protein